MPAAVCSFVGSEKELRHATADGSAVGRKKRWCATRAPQRPCGLSRMAAAYQAAEGIKPGLVEAEA